MDTPRIRVLLIEDDPADIVLLKDVYAETKKESLIFETADRLATGLNRIRQGQIDVVLLDLGLPDAQGLDNVFQVRRQDEDIPIIVLTGLNDETAAIKAVQMGAQDYLIKGNIQGELLERAIRYAIERQKLTAQLQKSLREIKTLRGLLPICASCKQIRNDNGYWIQIESYVSEHSDAVFSHGICPACAHKLYPSLYPDPPPVAAITTPPTAQP